MNIEAALAIPGRCQRLELEWLYKLATKAPPGLPMVDLGTFQGRTAAVLCMVANEIGSEVITIDNYVHDGAFTGHYKALPNDPDYGKSPEEYAEMTRENLARAELEARVIVGDSAVVPEGIEKIGLLFIDSEHTRERFTAECDAWLPLLAEGGILACHDYEQPQWTDMMPIINERIRSRADEWEYLGLVIWLVGFKKRKDTMTEEKEILKKKSKRALPELALRDGMVVGAPSMGIWCIDEGKRRHIPDARTQIAMAIGMHHVIMLHPEQLEAVPEGEPMPRLR